MADKAHSAGNPACNTNMPADADSNQDPTVVAYLRRKGLVGPLTDAFVADIDWTVRGKALAKALSITTCYSNNAQGAQAYIDDLLALHGQDISAVPQDANVRVVSRWIETIRLQILSGEEEV